MIKKTILILLILIMTGCESTPQNTSDVEPTMECGYQYTYGCGFDAISGSTKCGYGYYYVCH